MKPCKRCLRTDHTRLDAHELCPSCVARSRPVCPRCQHGVLCQQWVPIQVCPVCGPHSPDFSRQYDCTLLLRLLQDFPEWRRDQERTDAAMRSLDRCVAVLSALNLD